MVGDTFTWKFTVDVPGEFKNVSVAFTDQITTNEGFVFTTNVVPPSLACPNKDPLSLFCNLVPPYPQTFTWEATATVAGNWSNTAVVSTPGGSSNSTDTVQVIAPGCDAKVEKTPPSQTVVPGSPAAPITSTITVVAGTCNEITFTDT